MTEGSLPAPADAASRLDRRRFGIGLASALGVAMTGCALNRESFRFRMTLAATMHGVRYSSASVIEARVRLKPFEAGDSGGGILDLTGDAVAIDLPGGRTLFGLRDQDLALRVARLFSGNTEGPQNEGIAFDNIGADFRPGESRALDGKQFPALALVEAGDPATLRRITPEALAGLGIAPVVTRVTITNEAPTAHFLENRYPWIRELGQRERIDGPRYPVSGILAQMKN